MAQKNILSNPVRVMREMKKFTAKNAYYTSLQRVVLTEGGSAVATDSYSAARWSGVYSGEHIEIPGEIIAKMAKCTIKGNEEAFVRKEGNTVEVKMESGKTFKAESEGGKFPTMKSVENVLKSDAVAVAYVDPKKLYPILGEWKKRREPVRIIIHGGTFKLEGAKAEKLPNVTFENACEGENIDICIDPEKMLRALKAADGKEKAPYGGSVVRIELQGGLDKPVRIAAGDFETATMPVDPYPSDKKNGKKLARKVEEKALEKARANVKAAAADLGSGVTEIVIEPVRKPKKKTGNRNHDNELKVEALAKVKQSETLADLDNIDHDYLLRKISEKYIGERDMRAEVAAAIDETRRKFKEANEKMAKRVTETAAETATVTLESVEKIFEDDNKVAVYQKREGASIWVSGNTKPHRDELKALGFRWSGKRKEWWFKPSK